MSEKLRELADRLAQAGCVMELYPSESQELYAIETELRALAGDGWRPIAEAPRDGTRVLAWFRWCPKGLDESEAVYCAGILQWIDFNKGGWTHYVNGTPTHWQPLPAAPEAEA